MQFITVSCLLHTLLSTSKIPAGLPLNQDHVKDSSEGTYEESERRIHRSGLHQWLSGQMGRCRKGPLLEFKGLAKFYRTARCDLENPTERVGMPSIGKL